MRAPLKKRLKIALGVLAAYVLVYVVLSLTGGYIFTQSGQVRYGFGLSVQTFSSGSRASPSASGFGRWMVRGRSAPIFSVMFCTDDSFGPDFDTSDCSTF